MTIHWDFVVLHAIVIVALMDIGHWLREIHRELSAARRARDLGDTGQ